nr:MAG TPA: hypothetical protein [Caudoviricetes sp.]
MVIKNHVSYDWERFLETQSLEAIDNFITYMSQYRSDSENYESWKNAADAVRFQRAELKIPQITVPYHS